MMKKTSDGAEITRTTLDATDGRASIFLGTALTRLRPDVADFVLDGIEPSTGVSAVLHGGPAPSRRSCARDRHGRSEGSRERLYKKPGDSTRPAP